MENLTITINIDDYLSDSEKKEYAIEAFKEAVKVGMFKEKQGVQLDSEIQRVIGNISHNIVMEEIQKYIPNCEQLIKDKTLEIIKKENFSSKIFHRKDPWGGGDSKAITYMDCVINSSKEEFEQKIKDAILAYDPSDDIRDKLSETFEKMGDTVYKLSELFLQKRET